MLDDRDMLLAANLIHPHAHRHGRLVHAHPHDEDHSVIDHGEPLPEAFAGRYDPAMTLADRGAELRRLHDDPELLVMVNVWDVVSAKVLAEQAGCRAIATASHSIAASNGYEDGENIPVDEMLTAVGRIAAAVDLPVSADLEAGYGNAGETIRRAIGVGVVGANLDEMKPFDEAVAAVTAAVEAADAEGVPFALNARTDAFLLAGDRDPDAVMADAIERGHAFLEAGATCVFVPGKLARAHGHAAGRGHRPPQGQPHRRARLAAPGASSPSLGVARISFGPWSQRVALTAWADSAADLLAARRSRPACARSSSAMVSARSGETARNPRTPSGSLAAWSFTDWMLALHLLSAFAVASSLVLFSSLVFSGRRMTSARSTRTLFRVAPVGTVLIAGGLCSPGSSASSCRSTPTRSGLWDPWIIVAIVLVVAFGGVGQRSGAYYTNVQQRAEAPDGNEAEVLSAPPRPHRCEAPRRHRPAVPAHRPRHDLQAGSLTRDPDAHQRRAPRPRAGRHGAGRCARDGGRRRPHRLAATRASRCAGSRTRRCSGSRSRGAS